MWSFEEGRTARQLSERCRPHAAVRVAGVSADIAGGGGGRERIWSAHVSGQPLIFFSGVTVLTNGDAIVPVKILTVITSELQVTAILQRK
jgi:hypothetical protein